MSLVISRTPYRVSFFGGGSDYPSWFTDEGGAILSTTIDKYTYITCRYLPPFLGIKHRIVWRHIELVDSITEILHPAIRTGLNYMGYDDTQGLEIHYQGDLPARSGMGSSSSFVVGMIIALNKLKNKDITKKELANAAIHLEQTVMQEHVGIQDQIAAAYGGMNTIFIKKNGDYEVAPLNLDKAVEQALCDNLLLVFPGRTRISSHIALDVQNNLKRNSDIIRRMMEMVDEGKTTLKDGRLDDFGLLLNEAWKLKRSVSNIVSNSFIDDLYTAACAAGAKGGKLLGAGSAGFMLFYVRKEQRSAVMKALNSCVCVPFSIDREGAKIIY